MIIIPVCLPLEAMQTVPLCPFLINSITRSSAKHFSSVMTYPLSANAALDCNILQRGVSIQDEDIYRRFAIFSREYCGCTGWMRPTAALDCQPDGKSSIKYSVFTSWAYAATVSSTVSKLLPHRAKIFFILHPLLRLSAPSTAGSKEAQAHAVACAEKRECCTQQDNKPGACAVCVKLGICKKNRLAAGLKPWGATA